MRVRCQAVCSNKTGPGNRTTVAALACLPLALAACGSDAIRAGDASVALEALPNATVDAGSGGIPASADAAVDLAMPPPPDEAQTAPEVAQPPEAVSDASVMEAMGESDAADALPMGIGVDACSGADCGELPVGAGHVVLWLHGDDAALDCVRQGNDDRLPRWRDRSGHGHAAKVTAGLGPLCGESAPSIEGHKTVRFPRTAGAEAGEHLEVDLSALMQHPFTIAVVERRMAGFDTNTFMLGSALPVPHTVNCDAANPNSGRGLLIGYQRPQKLLAGTWGDHCGIMADATPAASRPNTVVYVFTPGAGAALFVDGRVAGTMTTIGLGEVGPGFIGRGFAFDDAVVDSRYRGDIAEVVAFDVALDDAERGKLEAYFNATWGGP